MPSVHTIHRGQVRIGRNILNFELINIAFISAGKPSTTMSSTNTLAGWSKRESKVFWSMGQLAKAHVFVLTNANVSLKNGWKCAANTKLFVWFKLPALASLMSTSWPNTPKRLESAQFSACQTYSFVHLAKKIWSSTSTTSPNTVRRVRCTTTTYQSSLASIVSGL